MKKVFSSILSIIALCGACLIGGNAAYASVSDDDTETEMEKALASSLMAVSVSDDEDETEEETVAAAVPVVGTEEKAVVPAADTEEKAAVSAADAEEKATAPADVTEEKPVAPAVNVRDTELVFIIDKSGSMDETAESTIANFNRVIDEQRREVGLGRAFVTTVMFNGRHQKIHDRVDLQTVRHITRADYDPAGMTALMDAVGSTIRELSINNEIAGHKVIFVIITDGEENASRRFSREQIREMIEQKKAEGWEFVFYGANIDVEEESSSIGINAGDSICFDSTTDEGVTDMFSSLSLTLTSSRIG